MSSPQTPAGVLDALRPIIDPDFGKSIVDLGFVKNLEIDGTRVAFDIELTTPACPVKEEFQRQARERVLALQNAAVRPRQRTANVGLRGIIVVDNLVRLAGNAETGPQAVD